MIRPTSSQRGYDARWRRKRLWFLRHHALCEYCGNLATEVDHRVPLSEGGPDIESNYRASCKPCHSRKTALRDGGFGRERVDGPDVRIVCGPDAVTCESFVRQHARPEDKQLAIAAEPLEPAELQQLIDSARNADAGTVWILGRLPDPQQRHKLATELGAIVTVLEVHVDRCGDPLRARDWWDLYRRRGGDRITTW